jgi:hypothetical protein
MIHIKNLWAMTNIITRKEGDMTTLKHDSDKSIFNFNKFLLSQQSIFKLKRFSQIV